VAPASRQWRQRARLLSFYVFYEVASRRRQRALDKNAEISDGYEDLVIADMRELREKFGKFDHDSTGREAGDQLPDQAGLPQTCRNLTEAARNDQEDEQNVK